jgi:hypothetical protein
MVLFKDSQPLRNFTDGSFPGNLSPLTVIIFSARKANLAFIRRLFRTHSQFLGPGAEIATAYGMIGVSLNRYNLPVLNRKPDATAAAANATMGAIARLRVQPQGRTILIYIHHEYSPP